MYVVFFFISPATYVLTVRSHSNKIAGYSYILSFRLAYCTPMVLYIHRYAAQYVGGVYNTMYYGGAVCVKTMPLSFWPVFRQYCF